MTATTRSAEGLLLIDLPGLFGATLQRLPWSMRILAENALRHAPERQAEIVVQFTVWLEHGKLDAEIQFQPTRVLMHDTTCVPALVDLAALRDCVAMAGGDPTRINPVVPVDVSIDHSISVEAFARDDAMEYNMARELEQNRERFELMKWAGSRFRDMRIHAPGTGIMHTINLEQLATLATIQHHRGADWLIPDTLIGTDSHTPMVNGLGVLAWGVGGLEAESVMLGTPIALRMPEVVGVHLTGQLSDGVLSTDLALTLTELLRKHGVTGRFVEFFGPGVSTLSVGDRAVIANMAPEYGATTSYFPIDARSFAYLELTGRSADLIARAEDLANRQGLLFDPTTTPRYTETLHLDLATVATRLAGPRRPQDGLKPSEVAAATARALGRPLRSKEQYTLPPDGAIAIAAITSCTNTTDPRLLIAAGLVARKARALGLAVPDWVKTSLAPGSPASRDYLERAGLLDDLAALGFNIVGFGCTTCIGNSGALRPQMLDAMAKGDAAIAVLSGNRNFPGRVHPDLTLGFLASPPIVIAYALAGDINRDIASEPIATAKGGRLVHLYDLWPTGAEIDALLKQATQPADYARAFADAEASPAWAKVAGPEADRFPWSDSSTFLRPPAFVTNPTPPWPGKISARILLALGDDITTDHISPAGQVPLDSEAGRHLIAHSTGPERLGVFSGYRGNWEVMLRGLFTNASVRNLLDPTLPPGATIHADSGAILPLYQAADLYRRNHSSLVIMAGERYGSGSSRDWAAKGASLLGVSAILARSFERIHRTNLIGVGIVPIRLTGPVESPPFAISDSIEIDLPIAKMAANQPVAVRVLSANGNIRSLDAELAVETQSEIETLQAGGIITLMLERTLQEAK
jgi:aconitate hydratase